MPPLQPTPAAGTAPPPPSFTLAAATAPEQAPAEAPAFLPPLPPLPATLPTPGWSPLTSTGFPAERANSPLLSLDQHGTPYLGYTNDRRQIVVLRHHDGRWDALATSGLPASASLEALRLGRDGTPYIACMDDRQNGAATVLNYRDGQWSPVGMAAFSPAQAYNLRLALDARDAPVVCFSDGETWSGMVMRYHPEIQRWLVSGGIAFGMPADDPTLALDAQGLPYVAYIDSDAAAVRVKRLQGGVWRTLNAGLPRLSSPYHPNLAFSADGALYLTVGDTATDSIRLFRHDDHERWQEVGEALANAARPTLAIGACGSPYLAFQNLADPKFRLQVRRLRETRWELVGTPHASAGYSHCIGLALAADNRPYLTSKDDQASSGITLATLSPFTG